MTTDEFKSVIAECLTDNDKLTIKAEEIINSFNESTETNEALKQEITELKEKNDELRKECQKWLLRNSFQMEEETIETKPTYEELTKNLKTKMKGTK